MIDRQPGSTGSIRIPINNPSEEERSLKTVRDLCRALEFDSNEEEEIALVVRELSTNGLKYGIGDAEIEMECFSGDGDAGLDITCSAPASAREGKGEKKSLGIAHDVIRNNADESPPSACGAGGLQLSLRKFRLNGKPFRYLVDLSVFTAPAVGETLNGDGFFVDRSGNRILLAVFDVLGHGPGANKVALDARQVFLTCSGWSLEPLLIRCQKVLLGTRGLAVAAISIDLRSGEGEYIGIGNVEVRFLQSCQNISLIPVPGIVGQQGQRIRKDTFRIDSPGILVMCSDGVSLKALDRDTAKMGGGNPMFLANHLIRDRGRLHDDRTALVAWFRPASSQ